MEQFGLRHRLVLASVKEEDFGNNYFADRLFLNSFWLMITIHIVYWLVRRSVTLSVYFPTVYCLATLVALHFTPVSKWVSQSVVVSD